MKRTFISGFLFGAVVGIDQLSKQFAATQGWVQINTGISFAWLSSGLNSWVVTALVLFALVITGGLFLPAWRQYPEIAALYFGGGVGNLIDRLTWGGVRDWLPVPGIRLHNNLADWALASALCLLVAEWASAQWKQRKNKMGSDDRS